MNFMSFPENFVIINGLVAQEGAGAGLTSIPISLKNVEKLWVVCSVNTAATSGAEAIVPQTDDLVAFGTAAALPATLHTLPIWVQLDAGTTDVITRQTDAVNYTTLANANHKLVIFEVDPSLIRTTATAATSEDCFRISFTSVAADDYVSVIYIIQPRFASKASNQPSYIID